ncbi:hypothetical protein [Thiobacillus sp.]|uniref:hypothetical protein n=1 Tax=Thiobacillus sp. TaxID=924 RepID=UPI0025F945AF|nr:hypothetical protein [Thiobacillus sp.]MBT9539412.1 hypothetical protein [Thiobacillus sp.]
MMEKLVHGFARLAFWRKPAATMAPAESDPAQRPADSRSPRHAEANAGASAEPAVAPTGWFTRIKHTLHGWLRLPNTQTEAFEPAPAAEHSAPKRMEPEASETVAKPSVLARLKRLFHRKPVLALAEKEADRPPASSRPARTAGASNQAEPVAEEDAAPAGHFQRLGAALANKRVWIPTVGVALLAVMGSMVWLLLQSGQEKQQLQLELQAANKKLKQAPPPKLAAKAPAPQPAIQSPSATTNSSPQPGANGGECLISDPKNIAENLKNCIDGFNAVAN